MYECDLKKSRLQKAGWHSFSTITWWAPRIVEHAGIRIMEMERIDGFDLREMLSRIAVSPAGWSGVGFGLVVPASDMSFSLRFAKSRSLNQRKNQDFFAGYRTDVVMQAQHL